MKNNNENYNEVKEIAEELYGLCIDMDAEDYYETAEEEIEELTKEILFLKENKYETLVNLLETILAVYK